MTISSNEKRRRALNHSVREPPKGLMAAPLFPLPSASDFNFKPSSCSYCALPLRKVLAVEKPDYINALCVFLFACLLFTHFSLFSTFDTHAD